MRLGGLLIPGVNSSSRHGGHSHAWAGSPAIAVVFCFRRSAEAVGTAEGSELCKERWPFGLAVVSGGVGANYALAHMHVNASMQEIMHEEMQAKKIPLGAGSCVRLRPSQSAMICR